jgi:hypothetical protein
MPLASILKAIRIRGDFSWRTIGRKTRIHCGEIFLTTTGLRVLRMYARKCVNHPPAQA